MIWLLFATKSTDLHIHIELAKILICDTTLHWNAYHFLSHLQSEKGGTEETDVCCSDANFALSAITIMVKYLPHTCGLPLRRDICHKDMLRNDLIYINHSSPSVNAGRVLFKLTSHAAFESHPSEYKQKELLVLKFGVHWF
jgi:hypothetical protein